MELKKAVSIVLTSTLLLSMLLIAIPPASAQATTIEIVPSLTSVTTLGQLVTVSCMVYDVVDLAGLDIQITWDATYLAYDSHTATLGCLNAPTFMTKNDVVGNTYWLAAASLNTVDPGFDGSGEAFEMTFEAINVPFGTPGDYIDTFITFTSTDLADSVPDPITHTTADGTVRIYLREFVYPPVPLLKVDPAYYEAGALGELVDFSVLLLGEGDTDLDPFWDVGGIDIYMNFNVTMKQALSVTIDPDYDFGKFWPGNLTVFVEEINNVDGYVHVAFAGVPGSSGHTPPSGVINMFTVTFNETFESTSYPPPYSYITLENPVVAHGAYYFHSLGGLIDLANPVGTTYTEILPHFGAGPHEVLSWEDDGDGLIGAGDQMVLEHLASGFYFDYLVRDITGTLEATLARTSETYLWAASFGADNLGYNGLPGRYLGSDDPYNGFGVPYWTGNFSLGYAVDSVNTITVHALPFTGDEYTYVLDPSNYVVHAADDLIELLNPVDVDIVNEHWMDGVNNTLNGWPYINYVASGIESVYVDMNNGTARFGRNNGYAAGPPGEWWYDPDWAWELEGWWALGYFGGPETWAPGSEWWINYTAASYLTVDYNTDPTTAFMDFDGTYADFLANAIPNPVNTTWNEVYPNSLNSYTFDAWVDDDTSGDLTPGDFLSQGPVLYRIDGIGTDIASGRKDWICMDDPGDRYFGVAPIVGLAGFPQPEADYCPWHMKPYSVPLPHVVENAVNVAYYKPLGGFIDLFICNYDDPVFKGVGKDKPADMRWPQKALCLCANVTYAGWPEQNKDVAFEIKLPNGTVFTVVYARTNENGTACIEVRLPWPCDDPEAIFGVWKVWATVDVACVVVNDTMEFKYDYRVRIFDVEADKPEYKHCEDITVHITYGTQSMSEFNITFTLTVTDDSGVPIGFAYMEVTVGGAEWCTYAMGELDLSVHVVKWARPPVGTIYVGALSDFPQNGGAAETPVFITYVAILAEWA
jgi:hypothetical protein